MYICMYVSMYMNTCILYICVLLYVCVYVYAYVGDRGSTVVNVLCYKSEGRWFDSPWRNRNFSLT